ncbi:MAG: hypothetical protein PVJ19_10570 [Desulfobacteraceae bacterium]
MKFPHRIIGSEKEFKVPFYFLKIYIFNIIGWLKTGMWFALWATVLLGALFKRYAKANASFFDGYYPLLVPVSFCLRPYGESSDGVSIIGMCRWQSAIDVNVELNAIFNEFRKA